VPAAGASGEWNLQGPKLQGTGLNECRSTANSLFAGASRFSLDGATTAGNLPITGMSVAAGVLHGSAGGADLPPTRWVGATLKATLDCVDSEGAKTIDARIDDVQPEVAAKAVAHGASGAFRYKLMLKSPVTGQWIPACDGDASAWATPFADVWGANGRHAARAGSFTFACSNAAIGKCLDWGYVPWSSDPPLHDACVRMARADYCSTGISYTRDGTWVDVWDTVPINTLSAGTTSPSGVPVTFEAAWGPAGALCVNHYRHADLVPACASDLAAKRCDTAAASSTFAPPPALYDRSAPP
jgi:hypothetical protein